jgi:hypothetical protein
MIITMIVSNWFVLTLAISQAMASSEKCDDTRGFLNGDEKTISDLRLPLNLLSANLKIKQILPAQDKEDINPEEDQSGRCTGFRTSTSGHVLTALHCMSECLESNSVFKVSLPTDQDLKAALLTGDIGAVSETPANLPILNPTSTCKVHVSGHGILDMEVVSVGDCDFDALKNRYDLLASSDNNIKNKIKKLGEIHFDNFLQGICPSDNDFVILKHKQLKAESAGCLPLVKEQPGLATKIYVSGFPMQTYYVDGNNSDGNNLFISTGQIVRQNHCSLYQSPQLTEAQKKNSPNFNLKLPDPANGDSNFPEIPQPNFTYDPNNMPKFQQLKPEEMIRSTKDFSERLSNSDFPQKLIQVTATAVPGNSGGSLTNSRGNLVGVATRIIRASHSFDWVGANTMSECRGSSFFVPIHAIKEKIRRRSEILRISDQSKEVFQCSEPEPPFSTSRIGI